jgi:hypothetical protein
MKIMFLGVVKFSILGMFTWKPGWPASERQLDQLDELLFSLYERISSRLPEQFCWFFTLF